MERPEDFPDVFAAAWNAHDLTAFAALFAADARFVNRFGHYVEGVDEIVEMHRPIHATIYADSTLRNELLDSLPLGHDVTVIHVWSRLAAGEAHPAGPHEVDTLIQAVLVRRDGAWLVQAIENVTLVDPRTGQPVLRQ